MATQHPDNAAKPYWYTTPFISSQAEIKESFLCFSDLGIDEYNWDWEGKFVDEAVVDRLLHEHFHYFQKVPLGREKFLTFRFPNPRIEKQFRLARALMVVITSSQLSQSMGFPDFPIFEAILPLTESAEEIIDIQEAFKTLVSIDHKLLKINETIRHIEIIPLFEQVSTIINSDEILRKYIKIHQKKFGFKPNYIRPYCARSDPALNSGLIPTILALKIALSRYQDLEKDSGVRLFPMLGTGSLPFRGGVQPENIENILKEYAGVKTLTLQSAFRYDYPRTVVKKAVKKIKQELPLRRARHISQKEIKKLEKVILVFQKNYQKSVENFAPLINKLGTEIAKRRERMQHIGLFGYSRGIGKVSLPRAIPFTACFYSLGLPPELIGSGRSLREAKKAGLDTLIYQNYLNFKKDLMSAGNFLNRENLVRLSKKANYWQDLLDDVKILEQELGEEFIPQKANHREHKNLSTKILEKVERNQNVTQLITLTGMLRKSLG